MRVIRLASALWLLCAPGLATAAIPVGSFAISVGGNQSIWFDDDDGGGSEDEFCETFAEGFDELGYCDFTIFVDGKGKIYGYLDFAGWNDGVLITLFGPIKGSLRGDGRTGIAITSYSLKLTGEANDNVLVLGLKASLKFTGQVGPGGVASGVWDERYCFQGEGCESFQSQSPAETLTNGDWLLELTIADAGGGALSGSARVEFGDGTECLYDLSGKYSAKTDLASLSLTPTESVCAGTSIQLKEVRALDGTLLGGRPTTFFNASSFGWNCSGTTEIAASVDPGACAWSILSEPQALGAVALNAAQLKYKLFGYTGEASVYSVGDLRSSSFGRRDFVLAPEDSVTLTAAAVETALVVVVAQDRVAP